ncbi:MAG: hypothetical protein ABIP29_09055 [Candidatus Eisenbacteria bacterium]
MRTLARTLLVVLGLLASLREAGSAACASTCVGRPSDVAPTSSCAPRACAPAACCSPCGEPTVPCPLLEPTPQALVERAPVARALPEPAAFAAFLALPPTQVLTLDARPIEAGSTAPADRGIRPRAGPLWLLDLRLLL